MTLDWLAEYYVDGYYEDTIMDTFVKVGMLTQEQYDQAKVRKAEKEAKTPN